MTDWAPPAWAKDVLAEPGGVGVARLDGNRIRGASGAEIGFVDHGILRFGVSADDPSIKFYQSVGGANFHDRSKVGYAMTTLDTPIYAAYLKLIRPAKSGALVADIGGGDGRNATPWLAETDARVVVVDPIFDGLSRFRQRLEAEHPQWHDRVLLVEGDARRLPLRSEAFDAVQSIEALAYLNEEYAAGLQECRRVMQAAAHFLVSDRDYESGLLLQLLYFSGVSGMLKQVGNRDLWDGAPDNLVRSRCFTREELVAMAESCNLHVLEQHGISSLSLVLSYLRGLGKLGGPEDEKHLPAVHRLLSELGGSGRMMRAHTLVCRRA
ncbi:class I SAM-dependent methyltransferase [Dongia sp. agr-C8]